jgi:chromosome partitioning protein
MTIKAISIINMKGGVGKTTLAVNLAYALAMVEHKKILLIDIDPQFNATQYLVPQEEYLKILGEVKAGKRLTVADVFIPPETEDPSTVYPEGHSKKVPQLTLDNLKVPIWKNKGYLDLIPSTLGLIRADISKRGTENRLRNFVRKVRGLYDLILIDCPPTLSIFTLSAYLASDAILVPVKPDWLSTIGLPLLKRAIQEYQSDFGEIYDLHVVDLGIVFTMVDIRTKIMPEMMKRISKTEITYTHYLRQAISIANAVQKNKPFFMYDAAKSHWDEIIGITHELVERLEGLQS